VPFLAVTLVHHEHTLFIIEPMGAAIQYHALG
jgi:hypothetical protein